MKNEGKNYVQHDCDWFVKPIAIVSLLFLNLVAIALMLISYSIENSSIFAYISSSVVAAEIVLFVFGTRILGEKYKNGEE